MGNQPTLNTGNQLDCRQEEELKNLVDEFEDFFEDRPGFIQRAEHHIRTGVKLLSHSIPTVSQ